MRLSSAGMLGVTLILALIPVGCGGDEHTVTSGRTVTSTSPGGGASAPSSPSPCGPQLRAVVASMDAMRDRLVAGLTYEQYLGEVRQVRARYDRVPGGRLGIGCLVAAGSPAERALNRYIAAANQWGDCLAILSCDTESIEPKLQRTWAEASDLLTAAQEGLRRGGSKLHEH
jgi:hypothetical protein